MKCQKMTAIHNLVCYIALISDFTLDQEIHVLE